jgi:aminobenzoyl-glutamate utilization protein B
MAAGALGYPIATTAPFPASTDFGNVSQAVPSVQLEFGCLPAPLHTKEVAAFAATDAAHDAMVQAAQILAVTTTRLLHDPALIAAARDEFTARRP